MLIYEVSENELYLYHYFPKDKLVKIEKHGLLSLHALSSIDPKEFDKAIETYGDRARSVLKTDHIGYNEIQKYLLLRNLDIRAIYFAFWEMTFGFHIGRDKFIKNAYVAKLPLSNLQDNSQYRLIVGHEIHSITIKDIYKYCLTDSTRYQKKPGGKFLFSHIPHIAVITKDGLIPRSKILIDKI